jgi:hypothetical protein
MKSKLFLLILFITLTNLNCIFFDLTSGLERCYVEELFSESTAIIQYKLFTFEKEGDKFIKENIEALYVRIYDEAGRTIQAHTMKQYKDKFSFHSSGESYYKVCVEAVGGTYDARGKIFFKLKIASDNMDEPDISKAIKTEDVNYLHEQLRSLIKKGDKIIKHQEFELVSEDNIAKLQMKDSRLYYGLTVLQIVVIGIVFLYNLYSFVKLIKYDS